MFQFAKTELDDMEKDLQEVEKLRIELAAFFCEDIVGFKVEECFKIFHAFCLRFNKAIEVHNSQITLRARQFANLQENAQRKLKEEKEELKKKFREQQIAKNKDESEYLHLFCLLGRVTQCLSFQ